MKTLYRPLEKALGYSFRKKLYLQTALTHPSFRYETAEVEDDNQRLEFLGDAVLGLVSGAALYEMYHHFQEGDLTQLRSRLANTRTLARIAQSISLGQYLRLGHGETKSGGQHRLSNLSDALEAVIGAAYLDGGLRAVQTIFKKLFVPEIGAAASDLWKDNPKGALQEYCQMHWKISPAYRVVREEGPAHSRVFTVEVLIDGVIRGTGFGSNKREAETTAAGEALRALSQPPAADSKTTNGAN
ncbi:MAG TPA: ribonuclease III [Verrucomicrobia bacterium]|nr:MAG: ribonuclease III [Lentisphaerae bacterium GWF2_57_35]HBA83049.1 ribonuclease III [Verrucomicrobiota bacterium]